MSRFGLDGHLAGARCDVLRTSFSASFTELVGMSAKQYVTEWRMMLAEDMLRGNGSGGERLTHVAIAEDAAGGHRGAPAGFDGGVSPTFGHPATGWSAAGPIRKMEP